MTGHVIVLDRTINADIDEVWGVLIDVAHSDQILSSVSHVQMLSEGPYDVGTRWREDRSLLGHHGTEELAVTEVKAPTHTIVEGQLGKDTMRTSYSLTPHSDTTRLTMTMSTDTSHRSLAGQLKWTTWGTFDFEKTKRVLRHDLDDIAAAAEARHAAGGAHRGEAPAASGS